MNFGYDTNWLWLISLLVYLAAILVGMAIVSRITYKRGYERGVQDGLAKKLYAAYKEYCEEREKP